MYERSEIRHYKLVSYDEPKHVHVTLEDIVTGERYDSVYVSKFSPNWNNLDTSKVFELRRNFWKQEGREFSDFEKCSIDSVFGTKVKKNCKK